MQFAHNLQNDIHIILLIGIKENAIFFFFLIKQFSLNR